ncbi:MAG: sensor histidine kinase [Lachnospiraceae bacterium]|nr:sensor histidine kinase [Lachnospiraceae bacterium]
MVVDFLKEYQVSLLEEKEELEAKKKSIKIQRDENAKFLAQLREEDELEFDALSPRRQNTDIRNKISDLEIKQQELLEESNCIKEKIDKLNTKLDEFNSVLKVAKKQASAREKRINGFLEDNDILKLKVLETQELERQRIARDLHDSSVQSLTSMVHKIELCSKLVDMDAIRCKLELSAMSKTIKEIIEEMRQMIYNLRPMSFDDIGFEVTLERELSKIQSKGMNINYSVEGEAYPVNPVVSLTLLRVIQEACNNVVKHAQASMISVKIQYEPDKLVCIVKDNGKGFVLSECDSCIREDNSGFGLSTMKERVCLLSGKLDIDSKINVGTKIIIEIPMIKEDI